MKFTTLSIIASLALSSTATPVPQTPPEQFPALLSVVSLYTSKDCTFPAGGSGFDNGWTLTTRMDTWNGFLKKTDGCQPIRGPKAETPDPTILSFMPRILSPECTVTVYTDTECKEGARVAPAEVCQASETKWKSWALRNCALTKEAPPA